jgi:hypothetical protein
VKKITEITRRDIFDIIPIGIAPPATIDTISISWSGRLSEIDFLKRIYNLSSLPSYDGRFKTAEGDIFQHRENNYDWEDNWVFDDSRFELMDGDDEILLNFLCEMFHPAVRIEQQPWELLLEVINGLLKYDGYELYEMRHISGRAVYGWRDISNKNVVIDTQTESISAKINSEYISKQIEVMNSTIESKPDDAIGKAKELLESCCKTILLDMGVEPDHAWDSVKLMKEACKLLKLTPDDIDKEKKASETIKKVLGNLSVISQGIAELRNEYVVDMARMRDLKV